MHSFFQLRSLQCYASVRRETAWLDGKRLLEDVRRVVAATMNCLDLFAGCGGLSLDLKAAGIEPLWANDAEGDAATTCKRNHKGTTFFDCDARELLLAIAGRARGYPKRGDVAVLAGGAPCQGFYQITSEHQVASPFLFPFFVDRDEFFAAAETFQGHTGCVAVRFHRFQERQGFGIDIS